MNDLSNPLKITVMLINRCAEIATTKDGKNANVTYQLTSLQLKKSLCIKCAH